MCIKNTYVQKTQIIYYINKKGRVKGVELFKIFLSKI